MRKYELMKSEVKKVKNFVLYKTGKSCYISGWSSNWKEDETGFVTVVCEMCSDFSSDYVEDVVLNIFMPDRRKSFVSEI